jgi:hypothetical protein
MQVQFQQPMDWNLSIKSTNLYFLKLIFDNKAFYSQIGSSSIPVYKPSEYQTRVSLGSKPSNSHSPQERPCRPRAALCNSTTGDVLYQSVNIPMVSGWRPLLGKNGNTAIKFKQLSVFPQVGIVHLHKPQRWLL